MSIFNNEIRNRIRISVAAYAYEFENDPIMSDADFDALALSINLEEGTGDDVLDAFFRSEFNPSTGQWIHSHPCLDGIRSIWIRNFKGKGVILKLNETIYDQQHSRDLFSPMLIKPEPVRSPCRVCGKSILENPVYGGCHC